MTGWISPRLGVRFERERAERLAERLRAMGIEPDTDDRPAVGPADGPT